MAAPAKYDPFHLMRGVAALAACFVQTLNESDPSFQKRFLKRLEKACEQMRDHTEGNVKQELELLSCVQELLTGWTWTKGRGKRFLED